MTGEYVWSNEKEPLTKYRWDTTDICGRKPLWTIISDNIKGKHLWIIYEEMVLIKIHEMDLWQEKCVGNE